MTNKELLKLKELANKSVIMVRADRETMSWEKMQAQAAINAEFYKACIKFVPGMIEELLRLDVYTSEGK